MTSKVITGKNRLNSCSQKYKMFDNKIMNQLLNVGMKFYFVFSRKQLVNSNFYAMQVDFLRNARMVLPSERVRDAVLLTFVD